MFGASNFPLAFSTAGGDTISALAAGCSVVVIGHPAHPGTTRIVAQAVDAAIRGCGLHPGVFGVIQCGSRAAGEALVQHPAIRAVGFTGSLAGGRALFDLRARRPDPIPVFGELGSTNPIFALPAALAARGAAIAVGWCASVIQGAGQFCTKPSLIVVVDGPGLEAFVAATIGAIAPVQPQSMLTDAMAAAYRAGRDHLAHSPGVQALVTGPSVQRDAAPCVLQVSGSDWLDSPALSQEVFGPLGLIVRARDVEQMHAIARSLHGQLTCALHMGQADTTLARRLMPVLEREAGRILANGYPTGVEVSDAMVHGGPYPASTNFGATSVGALSIRRWLRPVCYQDMPEALLPVDLRLP